MTSIDFRNKVHKSRDSQEYSLSYSPAKSKNYMLYCKMCIRDRRISLSEYRDKFILKGGMLVAAMVGLDARSTMDLGYFPARTAPPDASMTPTPKNKENIGMTRLRAAKDIAPT